jgi:hypothetical protein
LSLAIVDTGCATRFWELERPYNFKLVEIITHEPHLRQNISPPSFLSSLRRVYCDLPPGSEGWSNCLRAVPSLETVEVAAYGKEVPSSGVMSAIAFARALLENQSIQQIKIRMEHKFSRWAYRYDQPLFIDKRIKYEKSVNLRDGIFGSDVVYFNAFFDQWEERTRDPNCW